MNKKQPSINSMIEKLNNNKMNKNSQIEDHLYYTLLFKQRELNHKETDTLNKITSIQKKN